MVGALAVFLVPVVVMWAWSLRPPSEGAVLNLARRQGVTVDEDLRPWLAVRIRRGRAWRAAGGTIGWTLYTLPVTLSQFSPGLGSGLSRPFSGPVPHAGYLLGCVAADLAARRAADSGGRAALLRDRRVADYVPPWALRLMRFSAATGLLLAPVALVSTPVDGVPPVSREVVAANIGIVVVGLVATELFLRMAAHRPSQATSPATLAADEALRADSARRVLGAGMVVVVAAAVSVAAAAIAPLAWLGFFGSVLLLRLWWSVVDTSRAAPAPAVT
jgi:hypothetical protein